MLPEGSGEGSFSSGKTQHPHARILRIERLVEPGIQNFRQKNIDFYTNPLSPHREELSEALQLTQIVWLVNAT
jgi:hypothetical protein